MARRIPCLASHAFRRTNPFRIMASASPASTRISQYITEPRNMSAEKVKLCLNVGRKEVEFGNQHSFRDAIRELNSLQSNAENLSAAIAFKKEQGILPQATTASQNAELLQDTVNHLERGGLSLEQLDTLPVIHVAGTKGKGTTCAFVESLLRKAGLRTGFFSSPHLVSVRERIRINGTPLSKETFTKYFFEVYNNMQKTKAFETDMPPYFRFLTCMCYYTLYHEKVDVAIIEVGIGGSLDSTNIVRNPVVTGITSLGMEHLRLLGETLEKIARQKAGIMKRGAPSFTIASHPPHILQVLQDHADEVKCPLIIAPPLGSYGDGEVLDLGVDDGRVSRINASLALQLANAFLAERFPGKLIGPSSYKHGSPYPISEWHVLGLQNCSWPGRFQVLRVKDSLTYYLDGAHTEDSLDAARNWFLYMSREDAFRVLVFNVTGERNAEQLLKPFAEDKRGFDLAIFCPIARGKCSRSSSQECWSAIRKNEDEFRNCNKLATIWTKHSRPGSKAMVLESVDQTFDYLERISRDPNQNVWEGQAAIPHGQEHANVAVLVTGSLYMVGTCLSILDPELESV